MILEGISSIATETKVKLAEEASPAWLDTVIKSTDRLLNNCTNAVDWFVPRSAVGAGPIGKESFADYRNIYAFASIKELSRGTVEVGNTLTILHFVVGGTVEALAVVGVVPVTRNINFLAFVLS